MHDISSPETTGATRLPERESWHGTFGGYVNHGCKCPKCREANRLQCLHYRQRQRAKRAAEILAAQAGAGDGE